MVYLRKNVFGDSYYDVVYESFVTVKLCMGNLKKKKEDNCWICMVRINIVSTLYFSFHKFYFTHAFNSRICFQLSFFTF